MKKLLLPLVTISFLVSSVYAMDATYNTNAPDAATTQNQGTTKVMDGAAFLAANKLQPDVITLPDGLQYKVLTEGNGVKPSANDTVTVDYAGTLIDGTEFDSSAKHGQPLSFRVSDVIPGWVEALQLMKVGSTWELFIPANLAYGEQGAPPAIGPNQTLIFKVTLLDVKK